MEARRAVDPIYVVVLVAAFAIVELAIPAPLHAAASLHSPSGGTAAAKEKLRSAPAKRKDRPGLQPAPAPRTAELGGKGQVDPISGLGVRNPLCDRPGQIRAERIRLSCRLNGTPESNYPASNYGFDVFIDDGIDAPAGNFAKAFVMMLNGIWLGLIFVLRLVLTLLGLAFGLNPFAEGETMGQITTAVGRVYREITDPWLSTLIVCGGIWFAHRGLVQRDLAAGVAGTLAGVALLIVGLWVVSAPRDSVGRAAAIADDVALGVIAAPQQGSLARPAGGYAEALARAWSGLVEVPFAGLNFSDVEWALGPPPPEAVERADTKFCEDAGALATFAALAKLGDAASVDTCSRLARSRYGPPRRVIDLYLRSSPGSPARKELWQYFDKDEGERYKAKVAAQGGDGVLTRLSMLALFAAGLLGAVLLLAWLAIRLFTQASIGFVLLLLAPLALFLPLLGDSGRRAFRSWGLTLIGAIAAKVIYAALLSVVLLAMAILGGVSGATGFLLSSAFAWAIFLRRGDLVGWLSVTPASGSRRRPRSVRTARRVGTAIGGATLGAARGASALIATRAADRGQLTRRTAAGSLRSSAVALADQRHREARRTVAAFEQRSRPPDSRPDARQPDGRRPGDGAPTSRPRSAEASPQERQRYERARALVEHVEHNQRTAGERWTKRDLERFAAQDAALLRDSTDPADHSHRAGIDRADFEALRGPEREAAEARIEAARKRDSQRLEIASAPPGRIPARPRELAEGLRQRGEVSAAERREHLKHLRRERRVERLSPRRNLSRGA